MPRKLGQHFLRDRSVVAKIVDALDLGADDHVLEIGPGEGVLTEALVATEAHVTAVELDRSLAERLGGRLPDIRLLHGDALQIDPCEAMPAGYKLAGNIPYYITGALLRKYLSTSCKPETAVLMVQLEVARRMLAKPGEMSLLSVSVQLYARPTLVTKVSKRSFSPPPKVDSAVVKLDISTRPQLDIDENQFFTVIRAGFGTKRKQLANALAHGLGQAKPSVESKLEAAGVAGTRRAEELSLEEWAALTRAFYRQPTEVAAP